MNTVDATFHVPEHIAQGLSNGTYERVGGVVREIESKQVVTWLREVYEDKRSGLIKYFGSFLSECRIQYPKFGSFNNGLYYRSKTFRCH